MLTGMDICHAETGAVKLFLLRSESIPGSVSRTRFRNLCVVTCSQGPSAAGLKVASVHFFFGLEGDYPYGYTVYTRV